MVRIGRGRGRKLVIIKWAVHSLEIPIQLADFRDEARATTPCPPSSSKFRATKGRRAAKNYEIPTLYNSAAKHPEVRASLDGPVTDLRYQPNRCVPTSAVKPTTLPGAKLNSHSDSSDKLSCVWRTSTRQARRRPPQRRPRPFYHSRRRGLFVLTAALPKLPA